MLSQAIFFLMIYYLVEELCSLKGKYGDNKENIWENCLLTKNL